jgi:hypothetical protein
MLSEGAGTAAPSAGRVVVSSLLRFAPSLLPLLKNDHAVVEDFEERLVECARKAEREVNARYFGDRSPTRDECGEEVEVDGCSELITRAMQLGREKHELALQCAREVLEQMWPAPFSIEQRYRYYSHAEFLELISPEEEKRLLEQGCIRELWRTIKPDIVLHADRNFLRAVLILDFKFPCPNTNAPRWTWYGSASAYAGSTQDQIYRKALGEQSCSSHHERE